MLEFLREDGIDSLVIDVTLIDFHCKFMLSVLCFLLHLVLRAFELELVVL